MNCPKKTARRVGGRRGRVRRQRVIKSAAISGTIKSRAALPSAWVTRARVRDHTFLFRGKVERKDDFVSDSLLGIWFWVSLSLSLLLSRRSFVFCEITVKLRKKCMRNSVEHLQGHAGTVETFLQKRTRQIKNIINRCRLAVCARGRVLKNVRALEKNALTFWLYG